MNPPMYAADGQGQPVLEEQATGLAGAPQNSGQQNQEQVHDNQCSAGACQLLWKPVKTANN